MSSHPEQTTAVRPSLLRLATAALAAVAVGTAAAPPTGAEATVAAPDPARFSTTIDNPFLPLAPGHRDALPRDRRGRRRPGRGPGDPPHEAGPGRQDRRRPGPGVHPRRARRGHPRLVRAGPPRQRLVLRREHQGVRGRPRRQHCRLVEGRPRRRARGDRHEGTPPGRRHLLPGVLPRGRRGPGDRPEPQRQRDRPVRVVPPACSGRGTSPISSQALSRTSSMPAGSGRCWRSWYEAATNVWCS